MAIRILLETEPELDCRYSAWGPPHFCKHCGTEVSWHTGRRWYMEASGAVHRCPVRYGCVTEAVLPKPKRTRVVDLTQQQPEQGASAAGVEW